MKYILVLTLIALGYVLIDDTSINKEQPTDYSDTSSFAYHTKNVCKSTGNFFDIEISVEYPSDTEDFVGRWEPRHDRILLQLGNGTDIDTIAHEVHHMVDTMMDRYNVRDDHYAAYLQGSFTQCVWDIVQEDLKKIQ